ncbi:ABC transporter ATP-binding protein/permease [Streptomyces olivaceus]|uniref:ABC transporter ATP-binding protein n=1 Tax=Streptomyces olivaceus TaxID=47716 RepID=UPI001CCF87F7|nr:ABC transporter ATP-binding protein [Streptomyces olivaceus]MBZ6291924.1 ABC transporter ATP-binding protein/permease [Streptomyces olivaceus]MBZ6327751.1 ABC transporter ATP-binding protein/permease [Streptomyces olivaceus]
MKSPSSGPGPDPAVPAPGTGAPPPLRALAAPVRGRLALAVGLQAVAALAGVVPFIAVSLLADRLTDRVPAEADTLWPLVVLACAAGLVALVCGTAAGALAHVADNDLQLTLRRRLARHVGRLPLGRLTEKGTGEVKQAVHDDVGALHTLFAHTLLDVVAVLTAPVLALAYLVTVDWRLALLAVVPLALGVLLFRRAMSGAAAQMAEFGAALGRISAAAVEFATGIAVFKSFGRGGKAHERFVRATDGFADFFSGWVRATLVSSTAAVLVVAPAVVLLLLTAVGAVFVTQGWTTGAELVPFLLLGPAVAAPMGVVGPRIQQIRAGQAAAVRITELLDAPTLPEPTTPALPDGHHISLRGVSFSYDGHTDVLDGVDLDLAPGTVTALVGPSGSGKSTLASLLPRFHDVTAGTVTLGGADLRDIPATELYRRVGFVLQDVRLLRASVADNIRLGRPDATDEEVERCARAARIHDRVTALPDGYATELGTAVTLSGGEAQRLSIARALLADAPVLVLDEATAYADPHSEALIQDALSALAAGRTLLVIAHRLSTIRSADRIVVLEDGRVTEQGGHDALLAAGGRYAALWDAQGSPDDVREGSAR